MAMTTAARGSRVDTDPDPEATNISGVGGDQQTKVLVGVEFYIQIDWFTNQWTKVKADIHVMPTDDNTSRLLGVDVIRQLTRLSVKFRE